MLIYNGINRRNGRQDAQGDPNWSCYLRVQRERMLGAVGGCAADSSRTGWVPNCFDRTPCTFCRRPFAVYVPCDRRLGAQKL